MSLREKQAMLEKPAIHKWEQLKAGMKTEFEFVVTQEDMQVFMQLSNDRSRIHHDKQFAQKNGFDSPVVYGAIIVSKLSYLVGMLLPGDLGLATEWRINFNNPVYVGDSITMSGVISHISEATHTVRVKFEAVRGGTTIAAGTAGSKLLDE